MYFAHKRVAEAMTEAAAAVDLQSGGVDQPKLGNAKFGAELI